MSRDQKALTPFLRYMLLASLTGWLGAKLLYLLNSALDWQTYVVSSHFWLGGGFVFYGGLLGVLIFTFIQWQWKWVSFSQKHLKYLLPNFIIAHAIGRVGCFFAGCCYGKKLSFAFFSRHPVQLYEAVFLIFLGSTVFWWLEKKSFRFLLTFYLLAYGIFRFLLEYVRADGVRGKIAFLSTSQAVSVLIIAVVLVGNLFFKGEKRA